VNLPPAVAGLLVRPIQPSDAAGWRPLWDGYNEFYGRVGRTALDEAITLATWARFFDPTEPVHALVAEDAGRIAPGRALYDKVADHAGFIVYAKEL